MSRTGAVLLYGGVLALGVAAPFLAPTFMTQLSYLWVFIVFALTWDVLGGQMGYNSFGNILFFGIGMYTSAVVQISLHYDLAEYAASSGAISIHPSLWGYLSGLAAGLLAAPLAAVAVCAALGSAILAMRGHYFAICTLGLGIAAGEIAAGVDIIGAGSGLMVPRLPDAFQGGGYIYYFLCMLLAVATFAFLRWLYSGQFGLAINAIRDDEDKAEAMGIHTTRYKTTAWCISAFFLGISGALVGNIESFIDPRDTAFPGATYGVWMVLMAILGGKGTLWGPVIGAVIFHLTKEVFWIFLLGWQRVALGLLIVLIVVFFPQGILGLLREKFPERFGHRVEAASGDASGAGAEPR